MSTLEPAPRAAHAPHFSDEADVDRFVEMLDRFERDDIAEPEWRAFRLVNGTYGQRQGGTLSMLRAKLPQGRVEASQIEVIADVADHYSRGFCHLTTRQNVQFHFIELSKMEETMRTLARAGITTKEACGNSVRNVTAPATTGVALDEAFDTEPYAEALTRYFLRHPLSGTLPRKFKVAFAGGGEDHSFAVVNDIGWHARLREGEGGKVERGFVVTVAGGTATLCTTGYRLFEFLPASEILGVALALLRVFDREGDRQHRHKARMKYVVKRIGWEAFRQAVLDELEKVRAEGLPPLPFDPESPPDRGEVVLPPGAPSRSLPLAGDEARWFRTNTKPQKQAGYRVVTVTVPLGDVTSTQLRALAQLCRTHSTGTLHATTAQNFMFRYVPEDRVSSLYAALRAIDLARPDADTLADVSSCPGADSCKLAVTQSRGLARELDTHFQARLDYVDRAPGLSVRISGCPNGCSLHHVAGIGFQGGVRKLDGRAVPQYFVMAGGGVEGERAHFGRVIAKIPARRITQAVERLVQIYEKERTGEERIVEFLRRADPKKLKAQLADLETLSEADARPEDFIDLGDTEAFVPIDEA